MSIEQILRYAYPARATGLTKEEVRKNLISAGWEKYEIDEALEKVFPPHAPKILHDGDPVPDPNQKKKPLSLFVRIVMYVAFALIAIGVILIALSFI